MAGIATAALAAFLAGAGVRGAGLGRQQPAQLTGAEWRAFGSTEKQAYLSGFLAGAAAEQVATSAGRDSAAASSGAIARLKAGKQLHFPYAPSVYAAQLDDYYWYQDHLSTPIVDVMIGVNRRMLNP